MRRKFVAFSILLLVLLGTASYAAETPAVQTARHGEADIAAAMDAVKERFQTEFAGCVLVDLWYDDDVSGAEEQRLSDMYDNPEAMVLLSNFRVDEAGGDGSFEPGETYEDWRWILLKCDGEWVVKDWGY